MRYLTHTHTHTHTHIASSQGQHAERSGSTVGFIFYTNGVPVKQPAALWATVHTCPSDEMSLYLLARRSFRHRVKRSNYCIAELTLQLLLLCLRPTVARLWPRHWGESVAFYKHNGAHLSVTPTPTSDKLASRLQGRHSTKGWWHLTCIRTPTLIVFSVKQLRSTFLQVHAPGMDCGGSFSSPFPT